MVDRKIHKIKRQISDEEVKALIAREHWGVLALNGDEGYPYGVPLTYIYTDDALYFHSAHVGYKVDCIAKDPKCCFTIVPTHEVIPEQYTEKFESVIAFGTVEKVTDEEEAKRIMTAMVQTLAASAPESGMKCVATNMKAVNLMKINIESMTGKVYLG